MARELNLDGGEITVLKTLGLSGAPMPGKVLAQRMSEMESGELIDTLAGLISMGYILASKVNVRTMEDIERAFFRVNPSYSHALRDSIHPSRSRETPQRRRRRS